jgi:hypothetical protein
VDTILNCIFTCLKGHKWNIILWIVIKKFGIFFINCNVYMFKAWHKFKMFKLHVQNTQTLKMNSLCFLQMFFFLPNVFHSLWKLKRILTLMIRREKWPELMKKIIITNLNTFGSKVFLTLKIIKFENVLLTKVIHAYVIKGMTT